MTETPSDRRSVLLTGASTGIGAASVGALVAAGFTVWATVRRQEDADRLSAEHGSAVTPLQMEVTDEDSVRAVGERVCAAGPLYGLVNNAGAALPGPLEYLPIDTFRRQLEVNLIGQLAVTQAVLPALRAAVSPYGDARIVMIGSIAGRVAGTMLGGYAAAKHGLVGLTGSLRAELVPSGIKVFLIEPGAIATPIWRRGGESGADLMSRPEVAERYGPLIADAQRMAKNGAERGLHPEEVAKVVRACLVGANPAPRQVVGRDAQVVAALVRLLPFRAVYRLMSSRRRATPAAE